MPVISTLILRSQVRCTLVALPIDGDEKLTYRAPELNDSPGAMRALSASFGGVAPLFVCTYCLLRYYDSSTSSVRTLTFSPPLRERLSPRIGTITSPDRLSFAALAMIKGLGGLGWAVKVDADWLLTYLMEWQFAVSCRLQV